MIAVLWLIGCGTTQMTQNPLLSIQKIAKISFDGTVAERVDAGGYSYLLLDDGRWVVGLDHGHQAGDTISVLPVGVAHDFVSARTGRTFDTLVFGVLSDREERQIVTVGTGTE